MTRKRWRRIFRNFRKDVLPKDFLIIVGGGGLLDASSDRSEIFKALSSQNEMVLWGAGTNMPIQDFVSRALNKDELQADFFDLSSFRLVGARDWMGPSRGTPATGVQYVPCASSMMDVFDRNYRIKRSLGVVSHAFLSEEAPYPIPGEIPGISMDLKSHKIRSIVQFIGESETIYTESYHAALWAQFLGRKVIVQAPVSSKFRYFQYPLTFSGEGLEEDIARAKSAPYPDFLRDARQRNRNFKREVSSLARRLKRGFD